MKILYYTWNEIIKNDICDAMKAYGHEVKLLSYEIKSYIKDIEFLNIVENELNNGRNISSSQMGGKPGTTRNSFLQFIFGEFPAETKVYQLSGGKSSGSFG